jgi:hypothetical protein
MFTGNLLPLHLFNDGFLGRDASVRLLASQFHYLS